MLFITRVKLTNTSVSASKKNGARAFYGFLCYTTFFKQRRNLCSQKIKFSQWRHVEKMFVLNFGVKTLKKNNNNFSDPIQQLAFWQKMRNLHSLGEKTTLRNMWNVFFHLELENTWKLMEVSYLFWEEWRCLQYFCPIRVSKLLSISAPHFHSPEQSTLKNMWKTFFNFEPGALKR